ncbi:MAG: dethiobiotin synthase [Vicinamibacterales bacterium]
MTAAALLHRFRAVPGLRYWKPIQTGIEQDDDTAEVVRLSGVAATAVLDEGVRLERPLSPHLAARLSGRFVAIADLFQIASVQAASARWIVEGAGGVLVPVNERELMVDLMAMLGLPVVVSARSGLGTINHTLMTIEALRARALPIAGVIMVGSPNEENRLAIERHGCVPVVGELPQYSPLTPDRLRQDAGVAAFASALGGCFS